MLQPKVVSDLRLREFGYRAVPLDPAYAALTTDGPIFFFNEPKLTAASVGRFSERDGRGLRGLRGPVRANRLVPAADDAPRAPGARLAPARRPPVAAARGRPRRRAVQARRPRPGPHLHHVGRRPARRLVRARWPEGLDRLERRGRRLGGPAHARHRVQPPSPRARGDRRDPGRLGPGDRRHGCDQPGDRPLGRGRRAPRSAPARRSPRSTSATAGSIGVTLADGEEIRAPIVASGAHPKTTILDLAGAEHFPEDVARDMRRYRTRGGSVKINMVLSARRPATRG